MRQLIIPNTENYIFFIVMIVMITIVISTMSFFFVISIIIIINLILAINLHITDIFIFLSIPDWFSTLRWKTFLKNILV